MSDALSMSDSLGAMLRTASGLVEARRPIDLRGMEHAAGRLCAAALDLPAEDGRRLRAALRELLGLADALVATLDADRARRAG